MEIVIAALVSVLVGSLAARNFLHMVLTPYQPDNLRIFLGLAGLVVLVIQAVGLSDQAPIVVAAVAYAAKVVTLGDFRL